MARANSPSLMLGLRSALDGAPARVLLTASVAAVSAVLAAVVFSTSLTALVSKPERFGWPFDVAATIDLGYGGTTNVEAIATTLERPDVESWGLASVAGSATIDDQLVPYVGGRTGFDDMELPVVKGQLPVASDEIALGAATARSLGLDVGSEALVKTAYGERNARIRGLVVLPALGPLLGDRVSLGTGALLPRSFVDAMLQTARQAAGQEAEVPIEPGGFVAIKLRPGVDVDRFLTSIEAQLSAWDASGTPPRVYREAVRPATVANLAAMRGIPVGLASVLGVAMGIGLIVAIAIATRGRLRELAVLRALGCIGRQLRATVRWQSLTVVALGLAVGIPIGLATGRAAYRAFASDIGVGAQLVVPASSLSLLVVVTVGIALIAAAGPGRRAARVTASEVLRQE